MKAHTQFHHFDGAGGQCSFSAFWQGARICHNGPQAWIKISGNTQTCAHYGHTNTLIFTILFTVLWLTIHTVMIYICYYIYTCELVAISGFWHSPIAIIRSVYRCLFSEGNDLCLGGHEVSAQYLRPARCCVGKRKQLRLQNLMVDQELITIYAIKSCHSMGISFELHTLSWGVQRCVANKSFRMHSMPINLASLIAQSTW